jgi:hypothetical protein
VPSPDPHDFDPLNPRRNTGPAPGRSQARRIETRTVQGRGRRRAAFAGAAAFLLLAGVGAVALLTPTQSVALASANHGHHGKPSKHHRPTATASGTPTTAAPTTPTSTTTTMPPMTSMPGMTSTTAPAATTPMPPMTGMPGMSAPVPGQWVSVDPAKQAADTAAFFARKPATVTGNPVKVAEFHATCTVSHHAPDDPIVFPGGAGKSHNHTFIGNTSTNANTTLASLKAAGTTCTPKADHSAYWVPTLYQNGKVVDPDDITVYYGSRLKDPSRTQPFPEGFRMITGDAKVQTDTPDHQGNHFWCAGIGGEVGRTADGVMPICAPTASLVRQVTFPDCWDGTHLDSPNHKAHVSEAVNGACPAAFPVAIPNVSFVIRYPLSTNTAGVTLASGTTFSMHADFFNAWEPAAQAQRVRDCLDQKVKCNAQGGF